jgi:hypothetical protein
VTSDSEWYGEPHTLTVSSVRLPEDDLDDGELEYEITHPPSCNAVRDCETDWNRTEPHQAARITDPGGSTDWLCSFDVHRA